MATHIIDQFLVTFGVDSTDFQKKTEEAEKTSRRTVDRVKKDFNELEDQQKGLAQAFRSMRGELVATLLQYTGAGAFTGFLTNLATGAANADRFGQSMGIATGKVLAWRQAMLSVGGSAASADSSLATIQSIIQNRRLRGDTSHDADLMGLGINLRDLNTQDPDKILRQIAAARSKFSGQEYSNRLQALGLPQDMIYLLQQGGERVNKLLDENEKNTGELQKTAKAMEDLQQAIAKLNSTLAGEVAPELTLIVKALSGILDVLGGKFNAWDKVGDAATAAGAPGVGKWFHDHMGVAGDYLYGFFGSKPSAGGGAAPASGAPSAMPRGGAAPGLSTGNYVARALMQAGIAAGTATGIAAGVMAEGGHETARNDGSGAFGIGQWLGKRKAELFRRYNTRHPNLAQQVEFLLWELRGGDHGGASALSSSDPHQTMVRYLRDFMRPQGARWEHARDLARDIARGHGAVRALQTGTTVHVGHISVHGAKDANAAARGIGQALKRHIVHRADAGVAP